MQHLTYFQNLLEVGFNSSKLQVEKSSSKICFEKFRFQKWIQRYIISREQVLFLENHTWKFLTEIYANASEFTSTSEFTAALGLYVLGFNQIIIGKSPG